MHEIEDALAATKGGPEGRQRKVAMETEIAPVDLAAFARFIRATDEGWGKSGTRRATRRARNERTERGDGVGGRPLREKNRRLIHTRSHEPHAAGVRPCKRNRKHTRCTRFAATSLPSSSSPFPSHGRCTLVPPSAKVAGLTRTFRSRRLHFLVRRSSTPWKVGGRGNELFVIGSSFLNVEVVVPFWSEIPMLDGVRW